MENPTTRRRKGRPPSFDRGDALRDAMLLFWRQGYETTSISDLTQALGVSAPSLYAAFGDKKRLFLEAMHLYVNAGGPPEATIAAAATARDAAWAMLDAAVTGFTGEMTPPGCLLATAAITGSPEAADVRSEAAAIRRRIETALTQRIEQGRREGEDLPAEPADILAGQIVATIQGLSTLARDGAPRDRLHRIAQATLRSWPVS